MAGDHTAACNVNKEVLLVELGLRQFSNTTIFKKNGYFVLSPSVQSPKSLWFDLRKVNIDRYESTKEKGFLLVRFFDQFLLANLDEFFSNMIDWEKFSNTKNSGVHWKFTIRPKDQGFIIHGLINKKDFPINLT